MTQKRRYMIKKVKDVIVDFISIVLYCLRLSNKASKLYTIVRIISRFSGAISVMVNTYLASELLNILAGKVGKDNAKLEIFFFSISFIIVNLVVAVLYKINEYCSGIHNEILKNYLCMSTMKKAMSVDVEYFDSPVFYDTIESVKHDSYSIVNIVWNTIDGLSAFITFISAFIIISHKNMLYTTAIIITIIPSTIVNQYFIKYVYNWDLMHIKEQRKMGYLQYIVSHRDYVMDIRLFNIGNYLVQKYTAIWSSFHETRKQKIKTRTKYVVFLGILPEICIGIILLYMAIGIMDGIGTIGDYTLYSGFLGQLSASITSLVTVCISIYEDRLRIDNVKKFERFQNKISFAGCRILTGDVNIEFKNVSFSYPDTDSLVLNDINFKVNSKEKVCIVGLNGAGKSTIMKLILRFYDVTDGEILVNNINIKEYDIKELRKCFSVYFQKITNYSFTLRENIILSDVDNASKNENDIIDSLKHSDALEMIHDFPNGLEQYITRGFDEEGVELSGGQHQKIALARSFYRDSQVILLDEPSAALDPEAEHRLFSFLEEYCKDKTTIFTSHRLSNIHLADYIILIENGKVAENGTHEELMKNPQKYAQLYQYQAEKYK